MDGRSKGSGRGELWGVVAQVALVLQEVANVFLMCS